MKTEVEAEELEEQAAYEKDPLEGEEFIIPKVSLWYRLRIWLARLEYNTEKEIAYKLKTVSSKKLKN